MVATGLGTWWVIGVGATLLLAMTALIFVILLVLLSSVNDETMESAVLDVERFIELTTRAREQVPGGLPVLDSAKGMEAAAAISRFQALKDEARRGLWASSNRSERIFGDRSSSSVDEK